jgi:hypothetical protein
MKQIAFRLKINKGYMHVGMYISLSIPYKFLVHPHPKEKGYKNENIGELPCPIGAVVIASA